MSDNGSFREIWDQAFKIYQEQTGRRLLDDARLVRLQSSSDLLAEIETSQKAFGSFRDRHGKLWSILGSCLTPINLVGGTLQSALSNSPFAPAVFAGVFHLVNVSTRLFILYFDDGLIYRLAVRCRKLTIIWRNCSRN